MTRPDRREPVRRERDAAEVGSGSARVPVERAHRRPRSRRLILGSLGLLAVLLVVRSGGSAVGLWEVLVLVATIIIVFLALRGLWHLIRRAARIRTR